MFDPRVTSLSGLTDVELDNKISELNSKYWMTHNPEVQHQIAVLLEMYKDELSSRLAKQYASQQAFDNGEKGKEGLDSLIKVT